MAKEKDMKRSIKNGYWVVGLVSFGVLLGNVLLFQAQVPSTQTRTVASTLDEVKLAARVHKIFENNCFKCHGENGKKGGELDFILDFERLRRDTDFIKLKNPAKSEIYKMIAEDEMPPGENTKLTPDEKAEVLEWIRDGAPVPEMLER